TEQKFAATKDRDAFAAQADRSLKSADDQVSALKDRASKEEGAAKDATNAQIDRIKAARDRLKDSINQLKSEDVLQWQSHQAGVQKAMSDLNAELQKSGATASSTQSQPEPQRKPLPPLSQ